jgi:hypothetical protein
MSRQWEKFLNDFYEALWRKYSFFHSAYERNMNKQRLALSETRLVFEHSKPKKIAKIIKKLE